jgi:transposase InsO family protein
VHGIQIAPRTYWAHRSTAPSKRTLWDTTITEMLAGIYEPNERGKRPPESLYGSLKMWAHLQRQGIPVARCTVERIMRAHGWRGVSRARRTPRTTEPDPTAARAGTWWVDAGGWQHRTVCWLITGWECSLRKDTGFVERALRHAAVFRARQGHPFNDAIHHSDTGSQYTAIYFTESLTLAGFKPSIGTVGDALDNGLAETTIGLYKTERIREHPQPGRS